ncbi:hypothetical protein CEXT_270911 [Caerostris extrusa]|uniref:Uncharacterized protein n=1 Tax=Caerostris extrusa TaxID=172846 RepID=A0AAV4NBG1_CAEEX|nr:hypothetical protein CEXT_270911 [Caerostris extrusa]
MRGRQYKGKSSSPVKKLLVPVRKSPSKSISTISSGFSSRRSSTDNITAFDDITPIQQQLTEINDRYKSLAIKINNRNQKSLL